MTLKRRSINYSHSRILVTRMTSSLCGILAAAWMLAPASVTQAAQPARTIEDARPVEKAMELLARELGWNITYEDPPYVSPEDMLDKTVKVIDAYRSIIPRGGRVTLPENVLNRTANEDPVALLESVLATEETPRGKVKRFKVLRSAAMFHVVPWRMLNEQGSWETVVPVLDTRVRVPRGVKTLNEFLQELCAEITASSGITVAAAIRPMHGFTIHLDQEWEGRARDLLVQALASFDRPQSWLLLYDIPRRAYVLHVVPPGTD